MSVYLWCRNNLQNSLFYSKIENKALFKFILNPNSQAKVFQSLDVFSQILKHFALE
jgi:hypothetical protein